MGNEAESSRFCVFSGVFCELFNVIGVAVPPRRIEKRTIVLSLRRKATGCRLTAPGLHGALACSLSLLILSFPPTLLRSQRVVQPASSSRSKLRLLQRRTSGGVPQSSITSFTSRPLSVTSDGSSKSVITGDGGGGGDVQLVSPPSSAAPVSAAGTSPLSQPVPSSQPAPPSSLTSATAPNTGFPAVRSRELSSPDVVAVAAVVPDKPQQ